MTPLRSLSDSDFEAAIGADGVVLVQFTASWCQPCDRAVPEVDALAQVLRRRGVVVARADIDAAPHAAHRADVRGVPSLVLFNSGSRVATLKGHYPREKLIAWVNTQTGHTEKG